MLTKVIDELNTNTTFQMWPAILAFGRAYAPYIVMPVAGVVGFIGYNIEDWLSDKHTPFRESTIERREKRREDGAIQGDGAGFS